MLYGKGIDKLVFQRPASAERGLIRKLIIMPIQGQRIVDLHTVLMYMARNQGRFDACIDLPTSLSYIEPTWSSDIRGTK
jgi:hypothetical protein